MISREFWNPSALALKNGRSFRKKFYCHLSTRLRLQEHCANQISAGRPRNLLVYTASGRRKRNFDGHSPWHEPGLRSIQSASFFAKRRAKRPNTGRAQAGNRRQTESWFGTNPASEVVGRTITVASQGSRTSCVHCPACVPAWLPNAPRSRCPTRGPRSTSLSVRRCERGEDPALLHSFRDLRDRFVGEGIGGERRPLGGDAAPTPLPKCSFTCFGLFFSHYLSRG